MDGWMDGGYDSIDLHPKLLVQLKYDAQLSKIDSEKAITKQVNKLWRRGRRSQDVYDKITHISLQKW